MLTKAEVEQIESDLSTLIEWLEVRGGPVMARGNVHGNPNFHDFDSIKPRRDKLRRLVGA